MAATSYSLLVALFFTATFIAPLITVDAGTVTFVLDYKLVYGNGFVIAGNTSTLGNWTPANAPLMQLAAGSESYWLLTVDITSGTYFEYKPVKVIYNTKAVLEWFYGNNLNLTVPYKPFETTVYITWNGSGLSSVVA
ncbi:hypothetical protein KP509_1Z009500 [Ceratopteris richardii]|nr:hypothetical protein KP509_1Z238400 [Ceratopteris richardii]KAH6556111.1 hypothetical protein KP509_1Z204300 [Ceratopteris richardii]KAH6559431.1 hypothetical protein KP509_1Z009500 [Ceratopteris richardii]